MDCLSKNLRVNVCKLAIGFSGDGGDEGLIVVEVSCPCFLIVLESVGSGKAQDGCHRLLAIGSPGVSKHSHQQRALN